MKLQAEWTDDCQGKKDYDGNILSISSRYWPRGGGFFAIHFQGGRAVQIEEDSDRPDILPSARSSLLLRYDEDESIELASQDFEAETQEEVQRQVETWAQQQMDRVVEILRQHFDIDPRPAHD